MSKIIGALLLVALAVRLVVLFFFKRNIVLNEISLVLVYSCFRGCRYCNAGKVVEMEN